MNKTFRNLSILLLCIILQSCASHRKVDPDKEASRQLPSNVSAIDIGQDYVWGGQILSIQVGSNKSILTILSFPLKGSEIPDMKDASGGRFIANYDGFLEPNDFKVGSQVSLVGRLNAFKQGKVSEADYNFPVIEVRDISLYKPSEGGGMRLPVSLGIGLGIGI